MNLPRFSLIARKIHRLCMLLLAGSGLVMIVTGLTMKYRKIITIVDIASARRLHSSTSLFFAVVFLIMLATGLTMYLIPYLIKRGQTKTKS